MYKNVATVLLDRSPTTEQLFFTVARPICELLKITYNLSGLELEPVIPKRQEWVLKTTFSELLLSRLAEFPAHSLLLLGSVGHRLPDAKEQGTEQVLISLLFCQIVLSDIFYRCFTLK